MFQQGNDFKHTAKKTYSIEWLKTKKLNVLQSLMKSLVHNSTKHLGPTLY